MVASSLPSPAEKIFSRLNLFRYDNLVHDRVIESSKGSTVSIIIKVPADAWCWLRELGQAWGAVPTGDVEAGAGLRAVLLLLPASIAHLLRRVLSHALRLVAQQAGWDWVASPVAAWWVGAL